MRRRNFIFLLGAGTVGCPLAARSEQSKNLTPAVGVLVMNPKNDPIVKALYAAFEKQLRGLGWTDGENVRIDYRYAEGDPGRLPWRFGDEVDGPCYGIAVPR
jgi:putative ABC transport system substrate-binding protein